jgi:phosphatidylserine/phosphatidylglycerophosphate/cardiolipin synthase-like enzyme
MVPIRHTEQVLTGLIDEAREQLFLVSFVAYKVRSVLDALKRAQSRGVRIQVLLERSATHGGSVDTDSIKTMKEAVPGIEFFVWEETTSESKYAPKVHAKCAVADSRTAFVTSANLTNAAMETNMELGLLLRGGEVPLKLASHLESLVTVGEIKGLA